MSSPVAAMLDRHGACGSAHCWARKLSAMGNTHLFSCIASIQACEISSIFQMSKMLSSMVTDRVRPIVLQLRPSAQDMIHVVCRAVSKLGTQNQNC